MDVPYRAPPPTRRTREQQQRAIKGGGALASHCTFDSVHVRAIHLQPSSLSNIITKKNGTVAYDVDGGRLAVYNGNEWSSVADVPPIVQVEVPRGMRSRFDDLPPESYATFSDKDFALFSDSQPSNTLKIELTPIPTPSQRTITVPKMNSILCAINERSNTLLGCATYSLEDEAKDNTCVGDLCGTSITSGSRNVAVGSNSMLDVTVGCDNTSVGYSSHKSTKGSKNVSVGALSLLYVEGDSNTSIGYNSGNNVNGNNNVLLGAESDVGDPSHNGCIVLGVGGVTTSSEQLVIHGEMSGMAKLIDGRCVVYTSSITGVSRILLTNNFPSGKIGMVYVGGRTSNGFTILSSSSTDTSVIAWFMFDP